MLIYGNNNLSRIKTCLETAHNFLLSKDEAMTIFEQLKQAIEQNWGVVCDAAELNETDRKLLWGRQFLNPFSFEGLDKK